jgi:outer membrane protein assembly factor BamB
MKISLFSGLLLGSLLVMVAGEAAAGKVKVWNHHKPADYDQAQLKGAVLGNTGTLRLSRELKPLASLEATHVWSVVADKAGNLYAGTGEEGKVYKVTPEGRSSVVYTGENSQVLSLAADVKGETIYAGTGPSAQVVRIDSHGAKVVCELPESYVWALALDPKGESVYAATGPHGKIYRITPAGKWSIFYDTKQDHVLCLTVAADGTIYAGTDKTGRVYRIDARGKAFVLYQAPQSEVRALCLAGDYLYAGTSSTRHKSTGSGKSSSDSSSTAKLLTKRSAVKTSVVKADSEKESSHKSTSKSKESKGSPASAPSVPASGENSVYRIGPDGSVREVFRHKALVLSLLYQAGRLFVGTGVAGQLFEVDESTREKSEIARLENGQILALMRKKDGSIVMAAGDPGKLYLLEDRYVAKGTVVSEVRDAKLVSKWGSLRWRARTPGKTSVSVATRSGNVSEPDETWSEWSTEQSDGEEAKITSPAGRYLQYRITLATEDPAVSPALESLALRYSTTNQAPEVTKIDVPDVNAADLENGKKLKLKWSATDANEDDLRYQLFVKKDGWTRWVELEDDLDKTEFEWDTTTTPSGIYRVKVVASDRPDNPEKEALTAYQISEPFVVCHTPPVVSLKTAGLEDGRMAIEASAESPLVRLVSASFVVNGKKWVNVFPTDGLFDGKRETFKFKTEALKPGTYVLVLKVQDASGNTGTGDVVFTVPARHVTKK